MKKQFELKMIRRANPTFAVSIEITRQQIFNAAPGTFKDSIVIPVFNHQERENNTIGTRKDLAFIRRW